MRSQSSLVPQQPRSFITTDVNPYYDSFVRWQFELLHKQVRRATQLAAAVPRSLLPCCKSSKNRERQRLNHLVLPINAGQDCEGQAVCRLLAPGRPGAHGQPTSAVMHLH